MSKGRRETIADLLLLVAGPLLLLSLFLPWSHQISPELRARYGGTAALTGIPADPTAWQVYSVVDVFLALVAFALVVAALRGGRAARLVLAGALVVALVFVIHALSVAPTNGVTIYDPSLTPPGYAPNSPTSGLGELVALVALALGAAGIGLSLTL